MNLRLPMVNGIRDVAERQLCTGCGVCAFVQPDDIRMVDDLDAGRRPVVERRDGHDADTDAALAVCPGIRLSHDPSSWSGEELPDLADAWGPVLEVWEGHASDPEIRFAGSSGGAATALALHCLEREGMHGVLHTTARTDIPFLNQTVMSRSREELLSATGSRYAPASPCDGLELVADAPDPCVFIGKPCDVAGARNARANDPRLDENLGLTIGIFCAGTPSTRGTLEMIEAMGVEDPRQVTDIRYRGNGWPGDAEVRIETPSGDVETRSLTYQESWGHILQRHRQWRCYACADHTGEFADVAVGDPWYREVQPGEPGSSLVVVRTEHGRRLVRSAIESGSLALTRVDPGLLPASQPNLLEVRGSLWGRILVSRIMRVPAPILERLPTFSIWWKHLSFYRKLQSIVGMAKRVFTKGLYHSHPVVPWEPHEDSTGDETTEVDRPCAV